MIEWLKAIALTLFRVFSGAQLTDRAKDRSDEFDKIDREADNIAKEREVR